MKRTLATAALAIFFLAMSEAPEAQARGPRYYAGGYSSRMAGSGYSYRTYRYHSPRYGGYRYHVATYHPRYPRHVYYYNPYTRKYWGRYDLVSGGYSQLQEEDKRESLADIPDSAFPTPTQMPPPEAGMEGLMLPPPEASNSTAGSTASGAPASAPRKGGCNH